MHLVMKTVMDDEGVELSGAPARETTEFPLAKVFHWLLIILWVRSCCCFAYLLILTFPRQCLNLYPPLTLLASDMRPSFLLLSPKSSLFFCITADENGNSPEIFPQTFGENNLGEMGYLKGVEIT